MGLRPAIKGALPTQIIDYEWGRFDYYVDDVMAPQNAEKTIAALDLTDEEKDALRVDSRAGAARQREDLKQGATRRVVDRMKRTHPAYTYPVIYGDVGAEDLDQRWQFPDGMKVSSTTLAPVLSALVNAGIQRVSLDALRPRLQGRT